MIDGEAAMKVTEYMIMLTKEEQEALRKKYFPRVPWTELGPVRRTYLVRTAAGASEAVTEAVAALAEREGFIEPGQRAVIGDADAALAAFRARPADAAIGMIFGTEAAAHWCDISVDPPGEDGWQRMLVRSEEGENLIALAHAEGILRFRRAE